MADDGYITIHRTVDAAEGELVAEMLRREGIEARFHRVSSTLIGMPAGLIEMTVDVPVAAAARAKEVLGDLEYAATAEAIESGAKAGGHADGDEDEGPAPAHASRFRALARAGFTLFLPGTVHLYAGRPWTALVLFLAAVVSVGTMVGMPGGSMAFGAALGTLVGIVLCDMVGGVRAANAVSRGSRADLQHQLTSGMVLVAMAAALGLAARTAVTVPGWHRERVLARFDLSCTKAGVLIESRDGDDRELTFHRVGIATRGSDGQKEIYDVTLPSGPVFRLRAGTAGRLPFTMDPRLAVHCASYGLCRIVFDLTIDAADRGAVPLEVAGSCIPGWREQSEERRGFLTLTESNGA